MRAAVSSTRRRFLRETVAFSALALLGSRGAARAAAKIDPAGHHFLLIGDWGWSGSTRQQAAVAGAMREFVADHRLKTEAVLLLGDNFYDRLDGVESSRWATQFEQMYPREVFDCPCYAVLGNHDYHVEPADKPEIQLAYGRRPNTRFRMPGKWYRFELPKLATFLALDSNYQPSSFGRRALTREERAEQLAWLKAELAKPRTTPYLIVFGHHPLYSNGAHGDSRVLIETWDELLRESRAHLYLCGHDHDLQHLEFAGHPTSFVISGGGGARLRELERSPEVRGPFGRDVAGFTHLQITPRQLIVRHVDDAGRIVHAFAKTPAGRVTLL